MERGAMKLVNLLCLIWFCTRSHSGIRCPVVGGRVRQQWVRKKETKSISTFFLQVESHLGDTSSQYPQRRNCADYFVVADQERWLVQIPV